ncbi:hypothetical protein B0A69_02550 [Chryseobacterium shigense]|uniref:Uncharacterized protein n=1 Tax=Chryseobacterium shigense TaxID=297244 RepID=A0A1N7I8K9_9FLAO|nr:hypothetical protein [Chryseobacterium shigense]PQA96957.1 hypothetical protein B0A69_02550 [Chryseobacterium shigense]SIS33416.1 hypothetical protein SAMN05421639_102622 [Chryseobacterium shigense]
MLILGENTHDDGSTFKTKRRLIKYLHNHMVFHIQFSGSTLSSKSGKLLQDFFNRNKINSTTFPI